MATLSTLNGTRETTLEIGAGAEVKIGRSSDNGIPLDDARASRYHARVVAQGDAFLLEDLDSTNGTRVNDRPVTRRILEDGDVIQIGTSKVQFHADGPKVTMIPLLKPAGKQAPRPGKKPAPGPAPKTNGPPVILDLPAPKAAPRFDLPPPKTVKVKLEPGRGRSKRAEEGEAPKRRRRRK